MRPPMAKEGIMGVEELQQVLSGWIFTVDYLQLSKQIRQRKAAIVNSVPFTLWVIH